MTFAELGSWSERQTQEPGIHCQATEYAKDKMRQGWGTGQSPTSFCHERFLKQYLLKLEQGFRGKAGGNSKLAGAQVLGETKPGLHATQEGSLVLGL